MLTNSCVRWKGRRLPRRSPGDRRSGLTVDQGDELLALRDRAAVAFREAA
jgi:hypothetical protein